MVYQRSFEVWHFWVLKSTSKLLWQNIDISSVKCVLNKLKFWISLRLFWRIFWQCIRTWLSIKTKAAKTKLCSHTNTNQTLSFWKLNVHNMQVQFRKSLNVKRLVSSNQQVYWNPFLTKINRIFFLLMLLIPITENMFYFLLPRLTA